MAYDKTLEFCSSLSMADGAATPIYSNHIKLAQLANQALQGPDLGDGNPLWMAFRMEETFAGGSFLRCELVASLTDTFGLTDVVIASTGDIPITHPILGTPGPLLANATHWCAIQKLDPQAMFPAGFISSYQYLVCRFSRTGTFTAGKVTARVTDHPAGVVKIYPSATIN